MENYCNNCGNYGHVYKNCRHPILSYGIILYTQKSELFENFGLKIFLLSLGSFHLIYLNFLTALKYQKC